MSNAAVVRQYFAHLFAYPVKLDEIRQLLTDDFAFADPMMSAESADDYIGQLRAFGEALQLHAEARSVVEEGDTVAALVDFQGPKGTIAYAQWFSMKDGKIARLESIYDPRSFFEA